MSRLLSDALWTEIRTLAASGQPKLAAVAYVSSDADIAFGAGDALVTDATDETIASGQTRARVLGDALNRGAQIYSYENLHAKVMVFGNTAVIGSCNISANSANVLSEAAWVSNDPAAVTAARNYVQGLVPHAQRVDAAFLARILQIPVRPRPRGPIRRRPAPHADVILLFFKQVLRGDLKKHRRRSATAQSGGGARDLRVSPAEVFRASLQQILPHVGPRLDVTQGEVYWTTGAALDHATVELWPPTRRRPLELRFARWWSVHAWDVPDALFRAETAAGRRIFYVLELDAVGMAWARVLKESELNSEVPAVAAHIRTRIQSTPPRNAAAGFIDLSTGRTLP